MPFVEVPSSSQKKNKYARPILWSKPPQTRVIEQQHSVHEGITVTITFCDVKRQFIPDILFGVLMHLWTVATNKTYHNITIFRRGYRISERGEGFGLLLTTKTWSISAHARDVFPLFIKFCGPPKENKKRGGGGVLTHKTPPL